MTGIAAIEAKMRMASDTSAGQRVVSLDVLRGLTMAFMVLVSNPGSLSIYTQLDHAPWDGLTLTDLVFPTFLWIVGLSITLAIGRKVDKGTPHRVILLQALKRAVILYLIGVCIYSIGSFDLHTLRFLGVLQRIAICFFVSTAIFLCSRVRGPALAILLLLAAYWVALFAIPVPGYGCGNLSIEGNAAHYIDHMVLGSHNYAGTGTWDPEGLLSTLPAICTTLFGVLCGELLRRNAPLRRQIFQMFLGGALLIAAGLVCTHWMPVNKKLWTVPFCLLNAGIDFLLLAFLRWLIDGRQFRRGLTLPLAFGQNALAVYILSEVSSAVLWSYPHARPLHGQIFSALFGHVQPPQLGSLLYALLTLSILAAVAWYMRLRKWIVKI